MSKLILAVIFNADAVEPLSRALIENDYTVTKISSTGGFLRRQNTTFMIGVEEERLPGAMAIIRDVCRPYSRPEGHAATLFVLDVAEFAQA
ncbi:MAG: cyclic-di-AMP receptor [Chloroflexi bacterium]|nr:cyclic-di-AMP receptor [Chloroflexota bacterium]